MFKGGIGGFRLLIPNGCGAEGGDGESDGDGDELQAGINVHPCQIYKCLLCNTTAKYLLTTRSK